jgi:hypothetical protein
MPPDDQDPDDIDARYRQLSAADSARPHGAVSAAVLANAARLAAERASGNRRSDKRPTAVHGWRAPLFGGLAAAALAGFLIIPRFTRLDPPPSVKSLAQPIPEFTGPAVSGKITPSPPSTIAPVAAAPLPKSSAQVASKRASPLASAPAPAITVGKGYADAAPRALVADKGDALRRSADSGDLPGLRAVLDEQVSIDSRDSSGRTALLLAVLSGRDAVVTALLARGADPNISDAYGETPLHAAIAANRTEIAQALRSAGAR